MTQTDQRNTSIDVLKGIAISAVVLGHHPYLANKAFNIIFSFHIPLFYFVSGYLFNPEISFRELLRKRFNSILKPYLFTASVICLIYVVFKKGPFLLWYPFWIIFGNGPNLPKLALHLWFLPSLFVTILFTWFLFKICKSLKIYLIVKLIIIAGLLSSGFFIMRYLWDATIPITFIQILPDNPAYISAKLLNTGNFILKGLPWSLDIIFITSAFFISGYIYKQHNLEIINKKHIVAIAMVFIFCALHIMFKYTIDLNGRRYDQLIISTIMAFTGIFSCVYISFIISKWDNAISKSFQYLGKYSLIIYIFHPIIENKIFVASMRLSTNIAYIAAVVAFAAGLVVPLIMNHLCFERFKIFRYWYYAK